MTDILVDKREHQACLLLAVLDVVLGLERSPETSGLLYEAQFIEYDRYRNMKLMEGRTLSRDKRSAIFLEPSQRQNLGSALFVVVLVFSRYLP